MNWDKWVCWQHTQLLGLGVFLFEIQKNPSSSTLHAENSILHIYPNYLQHVIYTVYRETFSLQLQLSYSLLSMLEESENTKPAFYD